MNLQAQVPSPESKFQTPQSLIIKRYKGMGAATKFLKLSHPQSLEVKYKRE